MKLINNIKEHDLHNIFVYQGDARELLNQVPDKFFNNIYILFPDPWPKNRHHKHRLINKDFLQYLSNKFSSNLFISIFIKLLLVIIVIEETWSFKAISLPCSDISSI